MSILKKWPWEEQIKYIRAQRLPNGDPITTEIELQEWLQANIDTPEGFRRGYRRAKEFTSIKDYLGTAHTIKWPYAQQKRFIQIQRLPNGKLINSVDDFFIWLDFNPETPDGFRRQPQQDPEFQGYGDYLGTLREGNRERNIWPWSEQKEYIQSQSLNDGTPITTVELFKKWLRENPKDLTPSGFRRKPWDDPGFTNFKDYVGTEVSCEEY